jgi:hypothetical protein
MVRGCYCEHFAAKGSRTPPLPLFDAEQLSLEGAAA